MGKDVILDDTKIKYTSMKRMPLERMPHQDVIDYLEAQRVNRLPPRFPRWEEETAEPSLQAVISRRELFEAKAGLEDARKAGVKAEIILHKEIDNLVKSEKVLGLSFIKFNGFVRENEDKRQRAIRKIEESKILNDEMILEIQELQTKYDGYVAVKEALIKMIEKYKIYEKFLDQSAELSPYLTSVQSVVKRYEALMSARVVIAVRLNENMVELTKTMERITRMTAEKNASINLMKYELRQKEKRHGAVKRFKDKWENTIVKISQMAYQKLADIHCVRFSSWDLYQMMAIRRRLPITLEETDQEGHYTFIQESINLLKQCVEESRKLATESCAVDSETSMFSGFKNIRKDSIRESDDFSSSNS